MGWTGANKPVNSYGAVTNTFPYPAQQPVSGDAKFAQDMMKSHSGTASEAGKPQAFGGSPRTSEVVGAKQSGGATIRGGAYFKR